MKKSKAFTWDKKTKVMARKLAGLSPHPTIYQTIMGLPEWDKWYKHQDILIGFKPTGKVRTFDYTETMECGWMSPEHFYAFAEFVTKMRKKIKKKVRPKNSMMMNGTMIGLMRKRYEYR